MLRILEYASNGPYASVMIEHLATAFGTTAISVSAILGTYYYALTPALSPVQRWTGSAPRRKLLPSAFPYWQSAVCCLRLFRQGAELRRKAPSGRGFSFCFTGRCILPRTATPRALAGHHRRNPMPRHAWRVSGPNS